MYVITIDLETLVLSEDLSIKSYLALDAYYFPHHDCFVYYDSSKDGLYSIKRYSYEDLIAESERRLGDYLPPKRIMQQYGIIE